MAQQGNQYIVEGGDNLFSIAQKIYKDQRMFIDLMRANRLSSGVIRPGMVLNLPMQKPGEMLSASMNKNLISTLAAENEYMQQKGKVPSAKELQDFISGGFSQKFQVTPQPGGTTTPGVPGSPQVAPANAAEAKRMYGTGGPMSVTAPPSTPATPTPTAGPVRTGPRPTRGEAISTGLQQAFTEGKPLTEQTDAEKLAQASLAGIGIGATIGAPLLGVGSLPGAVIGGLTPYAIYGIGQVASFVSNWLDQPVGTLPPPQVRRIPGPTPITTTPVTPPTPQPGVITQALPGALQAPPTSFEELQVYASGALNPQQEAITTKVEQAAAYAEGTSPTPVILTQTDAQSFLTMYNITETTWPDMYKQVMDLTTTVPTAVTSEQIMTDLYSMIYYNGYDLPIMLQMQNSRLNNEKADQKKSKNAKTIGSGANTTQGGF